MNKRTTRQPTRLLALAALALASAAAQAASPFITTSRSDFLSALGGAATQTQDFESFAAGTNLLGVQILPGVTLSTNLASLEVFQGSGDKEAFATTRNQPEALYTVNVGGNYKAIGFDIDAFNPSTPGPGFISFYFADGDVTYVNIPVLPTNATEADPIFYGVVSDVAVDRIVWSEGPETGGINCCEETALDNFVVASAVPEPATWWLLGAGTAAALRLARRRTQA